MQPILKVDLTRRSTSRMKIPRGYEVEYLGGASLAARLLYEALIPGTHPLAPEAPMLVLNGPLSGTSGPAVGRTVICARSPATGLWGESNIGGFWGSELRMAGFDGIWLTGRASEPVLLWIEEGRVEIHPAGQYWGMETYETIAAIEGDQRAGKVRVAAIGPAGEAQIPYALILSDHGRVAGRTGMGAVMGSKNLKAIVVRGDAAVPVAEPGTYNLLRAAANRQIKDDPVSLAARELGTASIADLFNYMDEMPKRYFRDGSFKEDIRTTGTEMKETILSGIKACHSCVIACGRVVQLSDKKKRKGPEYETIIGFGPNLGLNDLEYSTLFGELCDRFGVDSISMSNTIGLAFRLFEMDKIDQNAAGGLSLNWGNAEAVEALIHQTIQRQGLGELLARGACALGRHFGAEDEAVQVNGLEVPYHDPRGFSGMALVYATSPRGACHLQSDYYFPDVGQVHSDLGMALYEPRAGAEKAANVAIHQNWRTVCNSMIMCLFSNISPENAVELINAASDLDWSLQDMMHSGERGWNIKRMINFRLGLRKSNDRLPPPLLKPYENSLDTNFVPDLAAMLESYYTARGWDQETGYPSREKLNELGLGELEQERI